MPGAASYIGPMEKAPAEARGLLGSLLPVGDGAAVTVVYVPVGGKWDGAVLERTASSHLLIVLEEGAQAQIEMRMGGAAAAEHATEIIAGDGARCACVCLQEGAGALRIREEARVGRGAQLQWHTFALSAGDAAHVLRSHVTGEGGRSDLAWTALAGGRRQSRVEAANHFAAAHGGGEMMLRGIAQDHGSLRATGMIEIGPGGGGTDTYLTEDVLMLDATAKADAVPGLEIKTNDVKASHSASIRRITEDDLFFFGARGIPVDRARGMFIRGFLAAGLEPVAPSALRADIERRVGEAGGG